MLSHQHILFLPSSEKCFSLPRLHHFVRCILLVLETSRVEIAVLLNDLAYLKYEKPKEGIDAETVSIKQRNLGIAFSLVEKIIKLISSVAGDEEGMQSINKTDLKVNLGILVATWYNRF